MDSTLAAGWINAIAVIIGVILGILITEILRGIEWLIKKKHIRRVLSWEHAYNLSILEEFWEEVNQGGKPQNTLDYMGEFERNSRLSEKRLDSWGHQMWQSHSSEVASVLSKDEFNQSYRLHNTLDKFSSRRSSFAALFNGDNIGKDGMFAYTKEKNQQSRSPGTSTPNNSAAIYNTNAFFRPLWDECQDLYTTCHKIRNPIKK